MGFQSFVMPSERRTVPLVQSDCFEVSDLGTGPDPSLRPSAPFIATSLWHFTMITAVWASAWHIRCDTFACIIMYSSFSHWTVPVRSWSPVCLVCVSAPIVLQFLQVYVFKSELLVTEGAGHHVITVEVGFWCWLFTCLLFICKVRSRMCVYFIYELCIQYCYYIHCNPQILVCLPRHR